MLKKKKESEFVDLVKSDSRIDIEELRLVLGAKLEFNSSVWIFGMGIVVTLALVINTFPNDFYSLIIKYSLAITVGILYIVLLRRDPEGAFRRLILKSDYLEAKRLIENQKNSKT